MESALAAPPHVDPRKGGIRLCRGDITELDVDAFVFYARPDLTLGSGFGGAITARGGSGIQKELKELTAKGPAPAGAAVITSGGNLRARHIIHAVGPRFREPDTEEKLRRTVLRCLKVAEAVGVERLAFPAMGAGYYGIPPALCARVMTDVLGNHLREAATLREVVICVYDTPQHQAFEAALAAWS